MVPHRRADSPYWVLPALINGHDHLDFNLFSHLGTPPYDNSYQWGRAIYQPQASPIRELLQIPKRDRLLWGAYRNILSGVTTVQQHNPHPWWPLPIRIPPYRWAHSLGDGRNLAQQQRQSHRARPFFIHGAEGADIIAAQEVSQLAALGLLGPATVIIHGIQLSTEDIELLARTRTALVWCPSSNFYLYEKTAPVRALLEAGVRVILGSDSTLSGSNDLRDELHFARRLGLVSDAELYRMVCQDAAAVLGLGKLPTDYILIHAPSAQDALSALWQMNTETLHLVVKQGKILLASPEQLPKYHRLSPIQIDGYCRYIAGPLPKLLVRTERILGPRLYFGKSITLA